MATVTEGKANFIQGLSDLWLRFFKDKPTMEALYAGMEIPIGQAYLDLLSNVLNVSLRETPLFRKEFFKLLTIREDLLTLEPATGHYVFELTDLNLVDFKFLYNKIFGPTVILEKDIDYSIATDNPTVAPDEVGTKLVLEFRLNPFDWGGAGEPIPGVAYRTVDVVQDDGSVVRVRELAFWVPDAQIDAYGLYLNYGYLLNHFAPSSESYRSLLQGITQYFVMGPTIQHLTSALNVIVGLPVVRNDGEVLQSVDTTDPLYRVVKTDQANYQFDVALPLRADILDEDNWETLTFQAFESLSSVFTVRDAVEDPAWYFDSTVPADLMPDESRARRRVAPMLYENKIDNPEGLVRIGDPGFILGRDDDGTVPTGTRPGLRHLFSYIVFERFLRHHTFNVDFDPAVVLGGLLPFTRLNEDLRSIITPGKSAYTYLMALPPIEVWDSMHLHNETVGIGVRVGAPAELSSAFPTQLLINDPADARTPVWHIGDYFTYDGDGFPVMHAAPIGTRFESGKTPLLIGGPDPQAELGVITDGAAGTFGNTGGVGYVAITQLGVDPALVQRDVGRWILQRDAGDTRDLGWHKIASVSFYTLLLPTRTVTTALFESPVVTSGALPWALYATPTRSQMIDHAAQIEVTVVP